MPHHTSICTQEEQTKRIGQVMHFRSLKGSYFHVPQDVFLKCVFHLPNRRRSRSVSLRRGQVGPRRAERRRQLLPANMAGAGARGVGVGAGRGRGGIPTTFRRLRAHYIHITQHTLSCCTFRLLSFFLRTWSTPQRVRIFFATMCLIMSSLYRNEHGN